MQTWLQNQGVQVVSAQKLLQDLKAIAQELRQVDIWRQRGAPLAESLESPHPEVEVCREVPDPKAVNFLEETERHELYRFCRTQLDDCLDWAIQHSIQTYLASLDKRPRYAQLAPKVLPALRELYCQGKSQREVAQSLGMTNQTQVSRLLNLKTLLSNVRLYTAARFLKILATRLDSVNEARFSNEPAYAEQVMQQLDTFLDQEIFETAATEVQQSNKPSLDSVYAQRLRRYIEAQRS
jgi:transcriptional regulator with XRE-family HTH domain